MAQALVSCGLLLLVIDLFLPNERTRFLVLAFVAPLLIWLLAGLYRLMLNRCGHFVSLIEFIGKHSLEIYVANCMSIAICQRGLGLRGYTGLALELVVIGILSLLLFYWNKILTFNQRHKSL